MIRLLLQDPSVIFSIATIIISLASMVILGERSFVGRVWMRAGSGLARLACRHRRVRWSASQGNTRVCRDCGHRWRDRT